MLTVTGSKELRIPMTLRRRGRRWQILGARSSGDWSRKVLQSDVPSQENRGQASCDRLHVLDDVQAWRD